MISASRALSLLLVTLLAIVALASSTTSFSFVEALGHNDISYEIQLLPTHYRKIRVTFYQNTTTGQNFGNWTRFVLSNTTDCGNGVANAVTDGLTDPVAWTFYDQKDYYVATFIAIDRADLVYACVSNDTGISYYKAQNQAHREHFRLWGKVPTAKIAPTEPAVGNLLRVYVNNVPTGTQAALTTDPKGCDGEAVISQLAGGAPTAMTVVDDNTAVFDFTPTADATKVYVCVSTLPTNTDWALAPYDPKDLMMFRENHKIAVKDPYDQVSLHLTKLYFTIWPNTNVLRSTYVECNMPPVQGKTVTCTLWVADPAILAVVPADFSFQLLQDGSGAMECPFPAFTAINGTHVSFDWTPQKWGREGQIALSYQNVPVQMAAATMTFGGTQDAYFNLNSTLYGWTVRSPNDPVTKFVVLPPDTFSVDYASQSNLLPALDSMTGIANFNVTSGVPEACGNGTLGYEALHATLIDSVSQATMTHTISGLASKTRCRFSARYTFFPSTGFPDQTQTSLVGRVTVISRTVAPADLESMKTFFIYVQGSSIVVTGSDVIPLGITGDIRTTESLSFDFLWNSQQDGFRFEFEIYHTQQSKFYWSEPNFKCLPTGTGGETLAADVTALQNFYNGITNNKGDLTASWRTAGDTAFNGDPCLEKWVGVVCRNQRVVELQLSGTNIDSDSLPTDVGSLSALEIIRVNNNKFAGAIPASLATLDRLRILDISNNAVRTLPVTLASSSTNLCLKSFFAQKNIIDSFPTQTIDHPGLESLRLEWNGMTGSLPNYTDQTRPLKELSVAHNQLTGYMPPSVPFQSLVVFDLSDNKFEGPIPTEWSGFKNAQYIDISHNTIGGNVPGELALIRSGNYLTFRAQDNYLAGLVPRLPFQSYDLRQNIISCPLAFNEEFVNEYQLKGLLYDECDFSALVFFG